jgi:hypothetical protein
MIVEDRKISWREINPYRVREYATRMGYWAKPRNSQIQYGGVKAAVLAELESGPATCHDMVERLNISTKHAANTLRILVGMGAAKVVRTYKSGTEGHPALYALA